ncbi:MAG: RIP metalloprotease RseP [Sphingomonadaceae bacterium]|nr:RIP metalloprotease RseP [Sphingomonadaceae bacterium]
MTQSPGFFFSALSFLLVIGPLIFIHEFGHYIAGRACGVKADVFSIGFGRELFGWTDKRGTRWKVAWLPMGGYVKFAGDMNGASQPSADWLALPPEERRRTFQAKAIWQRFIIVLAGPATNFLFAITVFAAIFATWGEPRTPPVVASIVPGSAAVRAGFEPGDRILAIGGRGIVRFEDIAQIVTLHPRETLDFRISRHGAERDILAVPDAEVLRDNFGNETRAGKLGIAAGPGGEMVRLGPVEVVTESVRYTFNAVGMMVDTLRQIVVGERSTKELGGPLGIARIAGQQASLGWFDFVLFMTMISINLGFINLLPVPMLDGGHLFFYIVEAVRRRPVGARVQEWAFRSGLALLLTLMAFVTLNDLASLGLWQRLAGLIG